MSKEFKNEIDPKFFKALGDPNRLSILSWLANCRKPISVSDVRQCCNVDASVVSRHLSTLKDAGILKSAKSGKSVFYEVNVGKVVSLLRTLANNLESCCSPKKGKEESHE